MRLYTYSANSYVIYPSGHQPGNKVGNPGRQRGKQLLVMEPL